MNILLAGATGAMGKVVTEVVENKEQYHIAAGFGEGESKADYPVYADIIEINPENIDVIIDFSVAETLESILNYGTSNKIPIVIAATGHNEEQIEKIKLASEQIPVLWSGNMSLGINIMTEIVSELAEKLAQYDIEIIEKHHHFKKDAPSGTARMLYNAVGKGRNGETTPIYDRHELKEQRNSSEVGIHTIRAGSIVGEHSVIFAGLDEILEIKHQAGSKKIFAIGSLQAADFIVNAQPGLYSMKDIF